MLSRTRPGRRARAYAALALVAALALGACQDADTQSKERSLLSLTNRARAAAGRPALAEHAGLREIARLHAARMAYEQRMSHQGDLGSKVSRVYAWTRVGENVAYGSSAETIHDNLMRSSGHRANILGDFRVVGIGVSRDAKGRYWVTEVFAK